MPDGFWLVLALVLLLLGIRAVASARARKRRRERRGEEDPVCGGRMPGRQIRTLSLSHELDRFVADEVASGHYATASEVIRAGLRTLIEQQHGRQHASAEAPQR